MITREMIEQTLDRCIKLRHTCKYRMRSIPSQKLCFTKESETCAGCIAKKGSGIPGAVAYKQY